MNFDRYTYVPKGFEKDDKIESLYGDLICERFSRKQSLVLPNINLDKLFIILDEPYYLSREDKKVLASFLMKMQDSNKVLYVKPFKINICSMVEFDKESKRIVKRGEEAFRSKSLEDLLNSARTSPNEAESHI